MDGPLKVWIVCDAYNYEGYGAPLAVFSSQEAATLFAEEVMKQKFPPDSAEVFERVVDRKESVD